LIILIRTRKELTKIIWYTDFGAKFTKPVRQVTGSRSTVWCLPPGLRGNNFLVLPIQHDHAARTPHQCICVSPASSTALSLTSGGKCIRRACASSRVACHGACRVASSCGYSACSAYGTFCTNHVQSGPGCSAVNGIDG